ncbi:MAG: hypothetical protein ABW003_27260, partial [Microvirga sp.]
STAARMSDRTILADIEERDFALGRVVRHRGTRSLHRQYNYGNMSTFQNRRKAGSRGFGKRDRCGTNHMALSRRVAWSPKRAGSDAAAWHEPVDDMI